MHTDAHYCRTLLHITSSYWPVLSSRIAGNSLMIPGNVLHTHQKPVMGRSLYRHFDTILPLQPLHVVAHPALV